MENNNTEAQNGLTTATTEPIKPNLKSGSSNDEKAPDSSDNGPQKTRSNKGKKRKKPKDSTAPRQPLTGTLKNNNNNN